ncbi:MAG: tRNA (adenosine(37)-N6)-dimethylallyltransferase MiaA [Kovacikia sp.]
MSDFNHIITKINTDVPSLIVLCGPTATGKSGLAIALAERLNTVILSADSRQVYREFNIGTAKPSLAEQQAVPHYLIDICDPRETLTVAGYQQQAQAVSRGVGRGEERSRGDQDAGTQRRREAENPDLVQPSTVNRQPSTAPPLLATSQSIHPTRCLLLVGGTGLYIRSIVRGLKIPRVPPQPQLRSHLQTLGQCQCYAMLRQVDPTAGEKIHPNDQVRTLRSLEVFYVTGRPMSEQQGENPPTYPILQIGLDCSDSESLRRRIELRTGQMVEAGLAAEVESLCQRYGADFPLLNTLGYAEFKQYLGGQISLPAAVNLTVLHTRQFAKRQRTWFRADPEIQWFDADSPRLLENVWEEIQRFLSSMEIS